MRCTRSHKIELSINTPMNTSTATVQQPTQPLALRNQHDQECICVTIQRATEQYIEPRALSTVGAFCLYVTFPSFF